MSALGVIVDGAGDFAAFRARFGSTVRVLKTDGPRGHTVAPDILVGSARKQVSLLQALGCRAAMIVTDYEVRPASYATFRGALKRAVDQAGFDIPVYVVAPNMMIENWYIADVEQLSRKRAFLRSGLKQKKYEGRHGKRELRRLFVKRAQYNEVLHGAKLFPVIRKSVAARNSASFFEFTKGFELAKQS